MINEEHFQQVFKQMDLDGDGFIDKSEFIAASMSFEDSLFEQKLKDAFKILDLDKHGNITIKQFNELFGDDWGVFGKDQDAKVRLNLDKFIQNTDSNGDGTINFDEFKTLVTS